MSNIQQILASILNAIYGKDVRQAIHDGVEMAYNKADDAETSAAAAAEAASGSQESAAASAEAAAASASSASGFANQAEQYKNEAFHTTPAGYEDFVSEVNSSLDYLANTGVKNLIDINNIYAFFNTENDNGVLKNTAVDSNSQLRLVIEVQYEGESSYTTVLGNTVISGTGIKSVNLSFTKAVTLFRIKHNGSTNDFRIGFNIKVSQGLYVFNFNLLSNDPTTIGGFQIKEVMLRSASISDSTYQPYAQTNVALTEKLTNKTGTITLNGCNFWETSGTSYLVKNGNVATIVLNIKDITVAQWGYVANIPNEYKPIETFTVFGSHMHYQIRPDGKIYISSTVTSDTDIICASYVCKES